MRSRCFVVLDVMMSFSIKFRFLVVVPLGHRVRLEWFPFPKHRLLSLGADPHDTPIVTDLETGIVYAPEEAYRFGPGEPAWIAGSPERTQIARVVRCVVLTNTKSSSYHHPNVSLLVCEYELEPTDAYR